MSLAETPSALLDELLPLCRQALEAAERFRGAAREAVAALVRRDDGQNPSSLEQVYFKLTI